MSKITRNCFILNLSLIFGPCLKVSYGSIGKVNDNGLAMKTLMVAVKSKICNTKQKVLFSVLRLKK